MPSWEQLASINLHQVSLGVDKFSAELDLVDKRSSTKAAANNHFLVANLGSRPSANRTPSFASRTFRNSLKKLIGNA
jgi:hypothetical protein